MKNLNSCGETTRTTIKTTDMVIDTAYKVTGFKHVSTRFGPRVIVELEGNLNYFLPNSYGKLFNDDDTTNFNSYEITMVFKGYNKGTFNTPILGFLYNYIG